ncbi:MAG: electron transport complex subunit E [Bacilli bacterium]|nr:electron transport complex subunit E [Bacilli bacterium]
MNKRKDVLVNGIWKENPILVSLLGLCSVLAISTSVENALGMGAAVTFVLVLSNIIIALIRNIVPNEIRIPVYIVVIATLVVLVEMIMAAFLPSLYNSLGIFIPLIVVNCIILGRAEAFASKNGVFDSLLDAIGMSIGYTAVLIVLSVIREFLAEGSVTIWGNLKLTLADDPGSFFTDFFKKPASAFILLGVFIGVANLINTRKKGANK